MQTRVYEKQMLFPTDTPVASVSYNTENIISTF